LNKKRLINLWNILIFYNLISKFLLNYSYLYDPKTVNQLGKQSNIGIEFISSTTHTNFSVTSFKTSSKTLKSHQINVYGFWAFKKNLPAESPFYLKLLKFINKKNPSSPEGETNVANYLFHSE
jgi:hypothetical protein